MCVSMCVLHQSLCLWSVPRSSLLYCGYLLWSSRCWCPWPGAASRSSPGWSGWSRSACRSGPCRSPTHPPRGEGSRRGKGAGWSGWSSVPGGWCRQASRSGPGLTKIPSDWEKERERGGTVSHLLYNQGKVPRQPVIGHDGRYSQLSESKSTAAPANWQPLSSKTP